MSPEDCQLESESKWLSEIRTQQNNMTMDYGYDSDSMTKPYYNIKKYQISKIYLKYKYNIILL